MSRTCRSLSALRELQDGELFVDVTFVLRCPSGVTSLLVHHVCLLCLLSPFLRCCTTVLARMQEARRCLDRLLKISPNCRQAISLRDVVDDKIAKGMFLVFSCPRSLIVLSLFSPIVRFVLLLLIGWMGG